MSKPQPPTPDEVDHEHRRQAFGAWVEDYHQFRPRYPAELIQQIMAAANSLGPEAARADGRPVGTDTGPRVLELGAGTGILTEALAAAGADVTALEPDERMHAALAQNYDADRCLVGSAEAVPLPDNSVDVVVGAQMWHWVDPAKAIPEVARVLRPGGFLMIVWALRDDRESWVADLNEAIGLTDTYRHFTDDHFPSLGPCFSQPVATTLEYSEPTSADRLVAQFRTHSALVLRGDFEETEAKTRHLVATHPSLQFADGAAAFEQPYVCKAFSARRLNLPGPCAP